MKKTNNKGFSLVELIIVIAIMAILIGILAPQYMQYVDKSRVSSDKDVMDSIYNACTIAYSDPDLNIATVTAAMPQTGWGSLTNALSQAQMPTQGAAPTTWEEGVLSTLGMTFAQTTGKIKSNAMTANGVTIEVEVDANGNFRVYANGATDPQAVAAQATFTNYCVPQQY